MSNSVQTLTLTLILALVLALAASPARGQDVTTSFSYNFSSGQPPSSLSLRGDAHYVLRMTQTDPSGNALPNSFSSIVHENPIRLWDAEGRADFRSTVKFIIRPNPGDENPGNGFFFDMEPVSRPIGSRNVDSSSLYGQEVTAILDYNHNTKVYRLRTMAGGKEFEESIVVDFSLFTPQEVQFGISASTGSRVAVHELISWDFTSTFVRNAAAAAAGIRQYV